MPVSNFALFYFFMFIHSTDLQARKIIFDQRSYEIITENYFVSATKVGENTINFLNCYLSE